MTIEGTIKRIFDEKHISDKFNIREFVVTTEEQSTYPQHILFQLVNSNCDFIIGLKPGDRVEINFNLKGRYGAPTPGYLHLPYNRLEVFRIYKIDSI